METMVLCGGGGEEPIEEKLANPWPRASGRLSRENSHG